MHEHTITLKLNDRLIHAGMNLEGPLAKMFVASVITYRVVNLSIWQFNACSL